MGFSVFPLKVVFFETHLSDLSSVSSHKQIMGKNIKLKNIYRTVYRDFFGSLGVVFPATFGLKASAI